MRIELQQVSKRYGYQWILRDLDLIIEPESILGVTGLNGSGKSTLMKILSGFLSPSAGEIIYNHKGTEIAIADIYKQVSWAAPYLALTHDFTIEEMYRLQARFKPMRVSSYTEFLDIVQLGSHQHKYIKDYSSGMQQRLQLGFAILSDTPLLLLDEPTSFLDTHAVSWYHDLLSKHIHGRTVVIASNDDDDLVEGNQRIEVGYER